MHCRFNTCEMEKNTDSWVCFPCSATHTHLVHMCDVWRAISSYSGFCAVVLSVWSGCVNMPACDPCAVHVVPTVCSDNNLCVLMGHTEQCAPRRTFGVCLTSEFGWCESSFLRQGRELWFSLQLLWKHGCNDVNLTLIWHHCTLLFITQKRCVNLNMRDLWCHSLSVILTVQNNLLCCLILQTGICYRDLW